MKVTNLATVKEEPSTSAMFTGPVTMQPVVGTESSKLFMIRQVNFSRGVRNKFHTHSEEQILIVTAGKGIVATDKEEITVYPGDIIFIPGGEKHWHGAAPGATFSHLYVMKPDSKMEQLEK